MTTTQERTVLHVKGQMPRESDPSLAAGMDFSFRPLQLIFRKVNSKLYLHKDRWWVIWQAGRQRNIDYAVCQALKSSNMDKIRRVLLIYDIMCKWGKYFVRRVQASPHLEIPTGVEFLKAIGDFHVKGHVKKCFPRFSLSFIKGAGVIDGEILETLWSELNQSSRSTRGATLAHRSEILDDHMNHSNWKKMLRIGEKSNTITEDRSDIVGLNRQIFKSLHLARSGNELWSSIVLRKMLFQNYSNQPIQQWLPNGQQRQLLLRKKDTRTWRQWTTSF